MYDIMIDSETYGNKPGCVMRSIGLVLISQGMINATLYMNLKLPYGFEHLGVMEGEIDRHSPFMHLATTSPSTAAPPSATPFAPPPAIPILPYSNGIFHYDPDTVKWWKEQGDEAKAAFKSPAPVSIDHALGRIVQFFETYSGARVWSHGSYADISWLEHYFRAMNVAVPFKFYDVRDTRTIYEAAGLDLKTYRQDREARGEKTVAHHALDDAIVQSELLIEAFQIIDAWKASVATYVEKEKANG